MISYYRDRAKEYEKIYDKPERQDDLKKITGILQGIFNGEEVFEIACGTGYWTERIARAARKIHATDINEAVLEVADSKSYFPAEVKFSVADIFHLSLKIKYGTLFGGFIWSHIRVQDLQRFLDIIFQKVSARGTIVFLDNQYIEGSSSPVTFTDKQGNTYQTRKLENGKTYEVLKNFPDENFIRDLFRDKQGNLQYIKLDYYWLVIFKIDQ